MADSDLELHDSGDDEVWTATGPVFQENRQFHRVPIDGSPVLDIDMDLAAPFPFLIVAPVEGGLLFSELLGATWLVSDAGDVSRQDEISAVLASGSEAFVAISCAPNALSCDATIHDRQGTQRPAVINDNFVFGTPLSPDGRWLPTEFGFVDMETGQRRSLPSSGLGQGLNSWSQNGRWFAQSGERDITIHDMDGELLPLDRLAQRRRGFLVALECA